MQKKKMILLNKLRALFDPERYQGWGNTRKYFEGWYFKIVNASETRAYAFIPGIAMDEDGQSHCFVQVLDGKKKKSEYYSFSASLFKPAADGFEIYIDKNYFSSERIEIHLPEIKGRLSFSGIVPWPYRWYSPGIMGPYTFVPFMECNHGIVSMDHSIEGYLTINGEETDFTGGRGYTEKDWGHSFPSAYIWMQSNHFNYPGISFKASVARIPWITGSFTGFIAGLWLNKALYSYTTYNKSSLKRLALSDSHIELEFQNQRTVLKITAPLENSTPLASPLKGFMSGRIEESMTSVVNLLLIDRHSNQIIYQGEGRNTSVELSGNIETLL
jgi:tocopherol cyclase